MGQAVRMKAFDMQYFSREVSMVFLLAAVCPAPLVVIFFKVFYMMFYPQYEVPTEMLPCFLCWIFSVFLYQVISVIEQWRVHMVLLLCTYYIFNKMYIITVSKYILHIWMLGRSVILQLQICCCNKFALGSLHSI